MELRIKAKNYRGLREIDWNPKGVCALVGPNGSGKSTLLSLLELQHRLIEKPAQDAINANPGGIRYLKNLDSPKDESISLGISIDKMSWDLEIAWRDGRIDIPLGEQFRVKGDLILNVGMNVDSFKYRGQDRRWSNPNSTILSIGEPYFTEETDRDITRFRGYLQGMRFFREQDHDGFDLRSLRRNGSQNSSDTELSTSGENVFTVLRNWRDRREDKARWAFVKNGLEDAFGDFFDEIEFETTSHITSIMVWSKRGYRIPASALSHGFLLMLLHLCAIASANKNSIIAIDEPENGLHPDAIHYLLEYIRDRANDLNLTVLLATHSPAVLNEFSDNPEQLYVFEPSISQTTQPVQATKLSNPEWLRHFSLGDLYLHDEFGAPLRKE